MRDKLRLALILAASVAVTFKVADFPKAELPSAVEASGGGPSRLKTAEIQDPVYGVPAFRMPIPEDWHFEGILLRDPTCDLVPGVAFRAGSPDGLTGMQQLPQFGWHWSDDSTNLRLYRQAHCKTMMPMNATDFLEYVIPVLRPNSTMDRIVPTVDAGQWNANIEQTNQNAQRLGMKQHQTGGAMRTGISNTLHDLPVEENFAVRMSCPQQQIGSYGGLVRYSWSCVAFVTAFRAPKGQLENAMKAVSAIPGHGAYTSEWTERSSRQAARDSTLVMDSISEAGPGHGSQDEARSRLLFAAAEGQLRSHPAD
jgi:hypothetical protein